MDVDFSLIYFVLVLICAAVLLVYNYVLLPKGIQNSEKGIQSEELSKNEKTEPFLIEWVRFFFPVLLVVFLLRSFVVEPYLIPSGSMLPTLQVGDYILVNKFYYGLKLPVARTTVVPVLSPSRGDVVVFLPPNEKRYFIKRVIGGPGDVVRFLSDKTVWVNGVEVKQKFEYLEQAEGVFFQHYSEHVSEDISYDIQLTSGVERSPIGTWQVPEDSYFLVGDNRDNSNDSRSWGVVPEDRIVGKAFFVWMHKQPGLALPDFSRIGFLK